MTYWNQCGWSEFEWGSVRRERFRFADSKLTGAYKHAGRAESYRPEISHDVSKFAGVVCVKGEGECRGTAQQWGLGPEHAGVQATIGDRETCFLRAGAELWKSDGTEAGTVMVKDINPGVSNLPYPDKTIVTYHSSQSSSEHPTSSPLSSYPQEISERQAQGSLTIPESKQSAQPCK